MTGGARGQRSSAVRCGVEGAVGGGGMVPEKIEKVRERYRDGRRREEKGKGRERREEQRHSGLRQSSPARAAGAARRR